MEVFDEHGDRMENQNGKEIAKKLMNLPREHRQWLIQNVAPRTFARWCRQNSVALRPYKTLAEKIEAHFNGQELSDLAKYESN